MISPNFNSVGPLRPLRNVVPSRGGTTRFTSPLCCAVSAFCANTGPDTDTTERMIRHDKTWARLNRGIIEPSSQQFGVRRLNHLKFKNRICKLNLSDLDV